MESWASFSFFVHCEIILFTLGGSTNIKRWMVKQEYRLSFCKKKKTFWDFQWLFLLFLLSDKGSSLQEVVLLGFSEAGISRADNSKIFFFLIAFEDGTFPNIFLWSHLYSLTFPLSKNGETRNLGCNCPSWLEVGQKKSKNKPIFCFLQIYMEYGLVWVSCSHASLLIPATNQEFSRQQSCCCHLSC